MMQHQRTMWHISYFLHHLIISPSNAEYTYVPFSPFRNSFSSTFFLFFLHQFEWTENRNLLTADFFSFFLCNCDDMEKNKQTNKKKPEVMPLGSREPNTRLIAILAAILNTKGNWF